MYNATFHKILIKQDNFGRRLINFVALISKQNISYDQIIKMTTQEVTKGAHSVDGYVKPGFEAVRNLFK